MQLNFDEKNGFVRVRRLDEKSPSPKSLSKYFSVKKENIEAFINKEIYVNSPDQFNDIFDTLYLSIPVLPEHSDQYRKLLNNVGLHFDEKRFLSEIRYRHRLRNTLFGLWIGKLGIVCMTPSAIDDLMWAHYTNNEGYCVVYSVSELPKNFGTPLKVEYMSPTEMESQLGKSLWEDLYANTLMKKSVWSYENEYRFLVSPFAKPNFFISGPFSNESYDIPKETRLQKFDLSCIEKVVLGFYFFPPENNSDENMQFYGEDASLKQRFLDYLIAENIKLENIRLKHRTKELVSIPIRVSKKDKTAYSIKVVA